MKQTFIAANSSIERQKYDEIPDFRQAIYGLVFPAFLFTSGHHPDSHKPSDTADRITDDQLPGLPDGLAVANKPLR